MAQMTNQSQLPHSNSFLPGGRGKGRGLPGVYRWGGLAAMIIAAWVLLHVFAAESLDTRSESLVMRWISGLSLLAGTMIFFVLLARRSIRAVRSSHKQYQAIIENLPIGILVRSADRKVVLANTPMKQWFPQVNETPDIVCKTLCNESQVPDTERNCICQQCLETGKQVWATRRMDTPDGERYFRISACPAPDDFDGEGGVLLMLEDATEHLAMEQRIQRASRLEALGSLATGVAHEINQPLTVLDMTSSTIEMLLERGQPITADQLAERIHRISSETARIADIINHMRALVKHEGSEDLAEVPVNDTVRKAISLMKAQLAAHRIELHLELTPGPLLAKADALELEQVVISLVADRVHVLDAMKRENKAITISTHEKKSSALVHIGDPLPESIQSKRITRDDSPGMRGNLGLSLAESLVNRWGGILTSVTMPDHGMTYKIRMTSMESQFPE